MVKWIIIYNDGTTITTAKSKKEDWKNAPSQNVQFLLVRDRNFIKVFSNSDEYEIEDDKANKKTGKTISDAEFKKTRNFMTRLKFDD